MAMTTGLAPSYPAPVIAAQRTFRAVMEALARPGRVQTIAAETDAPAPLMPAAAAIARALFDHETPVWLDAALARPELAAWLRFHTGAPVVATPSGAAFALIGDVAALPAFERFALGTSDYPDRSVTLVIQLASLGEGPAFTLRGPGIDGAIRLSASLPGDWPRRWAANAALFPRGLDVLLVAGQRIVGLPRATHIVAAED
jgi:alpha-D-ribose 1-methylphosphonate 5-triphosphate synthase subunit PhnH